VVFGTRKCIYIFKYHIFFMYVRTYLGYFNYMGVGYNQSIIRTLDIYIYIQCQVIRIRKAAHLQNINYTWPFLDKKKISDNWELPCID